MSDTTKSATSTPTPPKTISHPKNGRTMAQAVSAAALLVAGAIPGGALVAMTRPSVEVAPLAPVAISGLVSSNGPVTIRARVIEIFGHAAIVTDGSGRTMVDFGPRGDRGDLVSVGAASLFQGRFDHGVLHATFIETSPGHVIALAPPPPHESMEPHGAPPLPPPDAMEPLQPPQ